MWLACAIALAEGGLDRVASLVRVGDDSGAMAAIATLPEQTREQDALRYLEGRLLLATGRPCDAMQRLAQTPRNLPEPMRHLTLPVLSFCMR